MKYEWLLFDADGTLFDYSRAEANALEGVFTEYALPYSQSVMATYQRINHQVWSDLEKGLVTSSRLRTLRFERLFDVLQLTTDIPAISQAYLKYLGEQADLIEGARETIEELAKTHQLAIITNGLADVQRSRFAKSEIAPFFSATIISDEIGVAKPDPRYFDIVFREIKYPHRKNVLVIGDNLSSDIQGGINYQLDTCWFNPNKTLPNSTIIPNFQIQTLPDLFPLLLD